MPKPRILIIDDEESPRESLRFILKDRNEVILKTSGEEGLEALKSENPVDVVLLDMKMPGMNGLETLEKILKVNPTLPVVMITGITDAQTAVKAMKLGAADYLNKPFDVEEIRLVVQRAIKERAEEVETGRSRAAWQAGFRPENIVGTGTAMQKLYGLIERLMNTETTVLVHGETGTGKELVARALHFNSVRKDGPFVPVHCAAIPSELLESELFGHEKGAFTGAVQRRIGMFESAGGGTLFLDEIGEMPIGTQTKLLRAIQEREIRRVGGQETIPINVRLVCATNRNLEQEVKKGSFREDLFYRINVVPILLPSLRERREDIPQLIAHFCARFAKDLKREVPQFTPPAMESLMNYPWPGNVRELEHAIERLMVICDGNKIDVSDLPFAISQAEAATAEASAALAHRENTVRTEMTDQLGVTDKNLKANGASSEFAGSEIDLPKLTEELERKAIEEALRRTDGIITEAAKTLNITRRMLRYKMDKLGIAAPKDQEDVPADEPAENVTEP
jgi:DNA-binding NtrC family response regulator